MKTTSVLMLSFFAVLTAIIFSSCGSDTTAPVTDNADSCGDGNRRIIEHIPSLMTRLPSSTVTNGRRYYDFYLEYDSLCTDQHVSAKLQGKKRDDTDVKFVGKIEWAVFFERSDTGRYLAPSGGYTTWLGEVNDVGLKQAFGEGPGQVFVNVYVDIPTQGSLQADSVYLCQNAIYVAWEFIFNWHKPSSSMDLLANYRLEDLKFDYENPYAYRYRILEEFHDPYEKKEIVTCNLKFN